MDAIELISQDLFDKIRSRYPKLEMGSEDGNVTSDPRQARFFDFDFSIKGNNLGRVSISINERGSLKVFYGQGILEDSDSIVQGIWFSFLREMRNFAKRRLLRFDTRDITKSNLDKTDFQYLASTGTKEETMAESKMFGSSKSSYLPLEKTRLIIRHNQAVDETQRGARSRNINALYIENADGERFKYPFIHLAGAKAMQRHVANGGRPYDECGNAIIKMSENIAQLSAFKRHIGKHDSMHNTANDILERAYSKLESLRGHLQGLSKQGHYESWKESFQSGTSDDLVMDQATMEDYKSKFTVSSFKEDLTQYFPLLYSIMHETSEVDLDQYIGESHEDHCDSCDQPVSSCECDDDEEVKEFAQFANWADSLAEGRLADDVIAQLKDLVDNGLTLGVDGVSAVEALQGIGIDEDDLNSTLEQLARMNPDADPAPVIGAWLAKFDPDAAAKLGLEEPAAPEAPAEEPVPANPEADADAYADSDAQAYGQMESDEQIDELSKNTLGSYVKKAGKNMATRTAIGKDFDQDASREPVRDRRRVLDRISKDFYKGADKRAAGIDKAVDKLTREDGNQVAEVSKAKLDRYKFAKGEIEDSKYAKRMSSDQVQQSAHRQAKMKQYGGKHTATSYGPDDTKEAVIPKNTDVVDRTKKLAIANNPNPKGRDYVDSKEKMSKASAYGKKGPFHNIGKGLKAFVQGKEEPIDEQPENTGTSLLDIAEMVKSFYDRNTKKFPLGKTGVVTKVRKELGDHAGKLAERLCNELSPDANEETDESHGHEVIASKLKDIERKSQPTSDQAHAQHIERMKQQNQEYLKKNPQSIYKSEDAAFEDIIRLSGLKK